MLFPSIALRPLPAGSNLRVRFPPIISDERDQPPSSGQIRRRAHLASGSFRSTRAVVGSRVEHVLRTLIASATRDPHNWHAIPDYDLEIRILQLLDRSATVAFEIRTSSNRAPVHRYRYAATADTLSSWDYESIVHPNLTAHQELPDAPDKLAHVLAALFRARPESIEPSGLPSRKLAPESLAAPEHPGFGPLSYAFADIVRHVTANWFGGRETTWSLPRRLFYAFLGSLTFFAMQSVVILRDERLVPYLTVQPEGRDPASGEPSLFLAVQGVALLLVLLSAMFASISGYVDRQHGPARLYLGGFLLPYFTWALIVLVNSGASPS